MGKTVKLLADNDKNPSRTAFRTENSSMAEIAIRNQSSDFLILSKENGGDGISVRVDRDRETIWLTQKLMADLFDCGTDNIGLH